MSTRNNLHNSSDNFTINSEVSTDSFFQMDINSVGKYRIGVDVSDADNFKISEGSALGTNDSFVMNPDGIRNLPLQSAFYASKTTTTNNATGNDVEFTIIGDSVIFDQNGDYDNTTGIFTAPITGQYLFGGRTTFEDCISSSAEGGQFHLNPTSGLNDVVKFNYKNYSQVSDDRFTYTFNTLFHMDAADTIFFSVNAAGGSQTVNVIGGGANLTQFWGYLAV